MKDKSVIKCLKYISLLCIVLLISCNNKDEGDVVSTPFDVVGKYCREYFLFTFTVEMVNSDEYFLDEPWYANFTFYLIDDRIVVPSQTVKRKRISPGGTMYYIDVTLEGSGIYYAENKTLYLEIQEGKHVDKIWLRKQECVPQEGTYRSVDNEKDWMEIAGIPSSDTLQVNLAFEKNQFGDTGFVFNVPHTKCYIQEYVKYMDSTYFFVRMSFHDSLIEMDFSKRIIHFDSTQTVQYHNEFDMLFEGN